MKRLSKFALAIVIGFALSISVLAEEGNYDYTLTDVTYDADSVDELKLTQENKAKDFSDNLGLCKSLKYETKVQEGTDEFDTITVEASRERDNVIEEKEEEGYTVEATEKEHEAAVLNFNFDLLNDAVQAATINGTQVSGYDGKSENDITNSTEFQDFEDEDVKVEHEITTNTEDVSGSEIFSTRDSANARRNELRNQGYTANVTQNNFTPASEQFSLNRRLSLYELATLGYDMAADKNPGKEIVFAAITPNPIFGSNEVVERDQVQDLDSANQLADEKRATGKYETVTVETEIDNNKDNATLVSQKNPGEIDPQQPTSEYDEDVYTDNEVTGYRHHYTVSEPKEYHETIRNFTGFGSYAQCLGQISNYRDQGYYNIVCDLVSFGTTVMTGDITRNEDVPYYDEYEYNKLYFVRANYYNYTLSYIATDYTLNYRGTTGNIAIKRSSIDKFYEINGSRPEFTVNTTGNILEDTACLNANKTINTGVEDGFLFEIVAILSITGLVILSVRKTRKSN